jgi:hypothetical protein
MENESGKKVSRLPGKLNICQEIVTQPRFEEGTS